MGNSNCKIYNDTPYHCRIYTYNNADNVYSVYKNRYEVGPGETQKVEASVDFWGLKVLRSRSGEEGGYAPHVRFVKNGKTINMSSLHVY